MTISEHILAVLIDRNEAMDVASLSAALPTISRSSIGAACREMFYRGVLLRPSKGVYKLNRICERSIDALIEHLNELRTCKELDEQRS